MLFLLKKIYRFIRKKKRDYIYSLYDKRIFNLYNTSFNKNALLSYQPASFLLPKWFYWYKNDSLYEQNRIFAEVLKEMGFNVDVVSNSDFSFSPDKEYDLLFDTDVLYKKIYIKQEKKPKVFLHYTTSYYEFHNAQQVNRVNEFNLKTGKNIKIERPLETKNDGEFADIILSMGNEFTKNTFPKSLQSKVFSVPNYPMDFLLKYKKHNLTNINKKNFLYMASKGAILKGLDILLEVFARSDTKNLNLYVCGSFEREYEFMECYSNYFELPNIHKIGWIGLCKKDFKKIIESCSFHIFPSCTEGMPGALMSTMAVGIIPICTKESGLDIDDNELIIDHNVGDISKKIINLSNKSLTDLKILQNTFIKKSILYKQKHINILKKSMIEINKLILS